MANEIYNCTGDEMQIGWARLSGEVIRANSGYVTEAWGSGNVTDSNTTDQITHGLATTPTYVRITGLNSTSNDYGYAYWNSGNSTDFVVNVAADPGASGFEFEWYAEVR